MSGLDGDTQGAATAPSPGEQPGSLAVASEPEALDGGSRRMGPSPRPWLTVALLLLTDLLTHLGCTLAAVQLRLVFGGEFTWGLYLDLWPVVPAFVLTYFFLRLYDVPLSPAEEFRRLFHGTTGLYLAIATISFLVKAGPSYSRGVFVMAWGLAAVSAPAARGMLRLLCSRRGWWGFPAVVVGRGRIGRRLIRTLGAQPDLGLRPLGYFDERSHRRRSLGWVRRLGGEGDVAAFADAHRSHRVIVVASEVSEAWIVRLMHSERLTLRHLVVVAGPQGMASLGVEAHELVGFLGLQVRPRLLDPMQRWSKRLLEWVLVVGSLPVWGPVLTLLYVMVRRTTTGPGFFRQKRLGMGRREFEALKLRTMYEDAEQRLAGLLASDPQARVQWERVGKLKKDPRITPLGRWLRRTSLDELPQLINVLRGEMALVGPRPIVEAEVRHYGEEFGLYCRVKPGITGLWQVSGRNRLSYVDRVRLDSHYVRNWSIWLDLYILLRTVNEVLTGNGAQ